MIEENVGDSLADQETDGGFWPDIELATGSQERVDCSGNRRGELKVHGERALR